MPKRTSALTRLVPVRRRRRAAFAVSGLVVLALAALTVASPAPAYRGGRFDTAPRARRDPTLAISRGGLS